MSWRACLSWERERIEIDGDFETEFEARAAAEQTIADLRLGASVFKWSEESKRPKTSRIGNVSQE